MFRKQLLTVLSLFSLCGGTWCQSQELSVAQVERQPFEASVQRVVMALQLAGSPLPPAELEQLKALYEADGDATVVAKLQNLLDQHCLLVVNINPESRVKVAVGPAAPVLDERGWTNFLVKVVNEAGVTAPLVCSSPQAEPMVRRSTASPNPKIDITPVESARRWLDIAMVTSQPMTRTLSGLGVEYRILQLYSRDAGSREATLALNVGQGTQDLGFRSDAPILFRCRPSVEVPLVIRDEDGSPTTCSLLIKDRQGRVYPNPSRRLAPDFFFHEQVYRADGEFLQLAPAEYQIVAYRGPEYLEQPIEVSISTERQPDPIQIQLKRWIHMAKQGWFSGDHHVHAAGCAHYENPSEGVTPADMMRHILGEDLNVGCVLSWGPCWYFQKQFFEGRVSPISKPGYLMRYDVEVSGFPSSHAGHLCLLNLTEDDYPGSKAIEDWPSWTMPVLQWGQKQGGVVGYSHSGWGLALPDYLPDGSRGAFPRNANSQANLPRGRAANKLPDYAMPPFDGIGANEYIVTTALGACDFISAVDTPAIWELNIWYHTLNCGFQSRISGETDFPCIYGERVGLGRSYVQVPGLFEAEKLNYEQWVQGLKAGRSYVSDGLSHLLSFAVGQQELGAPGERGQPSVLATSKGPQRVTCTVAALLPETQNDAARAIAARRLDEKPYWHLERARIGTSQKVPVELVINGHAVAKSEIVADGKPQELTFNVDIQESSWAAIRVLPSMHSNPIFIQVDGHPVRASRKSAVWCQEAVDTCWRQKVKLIRPEEIEAAKQAYDSAKNIYREIAEQATDSD
ncbi:MAG: CehA/McbA family metallohydrolase [Planctomycetales bacterium]|nr:CehA/McbA family metallohydrolase [Planctomycetales bacterium]